MKIVKLEFQIEQLSFYYNTLTLKVLMLLSMNIKIISSSNLNKFLKLFETYFIFLKNNLSNKLELVFFNKYFIDEINNLVQQNILSPNINDHHFIFIFKF